MTIRFASEADIPWLCRYDGHIASRELARSVELQRVLIAEDAGEFAGWLRWNLFWDNTPFLNLLYVLEPWRGRGFGRMLMERWERQMREAGHDMVLTSTASDEYAQHFYGKLGYRAVGGFTPPGEPYELILSKTL